MKRLLVLVILVLAVTAAGLYEFFGHASTTTPPESTGGAEISVHPTNGTSRIQARQYTVLVDVSASRPSAMVAEGERYVDALIDQMAYGERLVILPMYEAGVNEAKADLDLLLSKGADSLSLDESKQLESDRDGLKEPVHIFFSRAQTAPVMHTDILTTLSIASEKISDDKKNELIILSDMLQSSREFEFERLKHMPPPNWIEEQKSQGLVRPLYGACVVVVGADPSTHEGVIVKEFWQKYFEASNANLTSRNYRTTPPAGTAFTCN